MKSILKNLSFTLSSNLISIIITSVVTLIVPKYLGVNDYGFFQLYMLYCNYIGFLHFGWADGIFLRYGGAEYDCLNKHQFSAQFFLYTSFTLFIGISICMFSTFLTSESSKAIIFVLTGIAVILLLPRTFIQYILQCTNRIKEYSVLIISEKIVFIVLVLFFLLMGNKSFITIIISDLCGKLISLLYSLYQCRSILFSKPENIFVAFNETYKNISVGIKLMFSNIASMLIIGFIRLSIENQWDVATFGKVSLALSISNLLLIFIRAVALVMFPLLRRTDFSKLSEIYNNLRTGIMIPLLGMLIFYYPLKEMLSIWLPAYADKLHYMALLFPICIFESKMSMLVETYLKTLRLEKKLLIVNLITLILSISMTMYNVYVIHNLDLTVLSIVILLMFRCTIAELYLSKNININVKQDLIIEIFLSFLFIITSWYLGDFRGVLIYLIAYMLYLYIKRFDIVYFIKMMREYTRRK
ncbi:hypothetical protein B5F14_08275 [Faecalitalea cylindroides]|uniref:Polysaccharide biosynthesis protein C-terminal domain-containing protein n=1 Tax=Faecalitalea cylindroides TaxID=39483 RepID=A0A1Y4LMW2_9FIRM|nr:oligosaccharide flippase family protein [Faecalitalea cylindroides]OUP58043.1 hypothetical protein B5F14_08275 [Faecalitalea cylindroides]